KNEAASAVSATSSQTMPIRRLPPLRGQTKLRCRLYPLRPPLEVPRSTGTHADATASLGVLAPVRIPSSACCRVRADISWCRTIDLVVLTVSPETCPDESEPSFLVAFPLIDHSGWVSGRAPRRLYQYVRDRPPGHGVDIDSYTKRPILRTRLVCRIRSREE